MQEAFCCCCKHSPPHFEKTTLCSAGSDPKTASPTTHWGGCSEVPLRNSHTFPATGAGVTGEATPPTPPHPREQLLLAGDTIPAKGVNSKLATTCGEGLPSTGCWGRSLPSLQHTSWWTCGSHLHTGEAAHPAHTALTAAQTPTPERPPPSDFSLEKKIHFPSFNPF